MNGSQRKDGPDVSQLHSEKLPQAAFPGGKGQSFRVYFAPEVHRNVWQHATDNLTVEICGVLVGKLAQDTDGPFVHISELIRGEAATNKFAEVTFTHETWARINHDMDTRFADLAIVGWYHSHPDFGVFLSDRDRFIQDHFFSGPGQIAFVVDPVRKTEGVFIWQAGKPALAPHYWVGDQIRVGTPAGEETAAAPTHAPAAPKGEPTPQTGVKEAGGWLPLLMQAALFLAVFLVGFLLAGKLTDLERARLEQNALARGFFAHRQPGLREDLNQVGKELLDAFQQARTLSEEHLKLLEDPKGAKERWNEVFGHLAKTAQGLVLIQNAYSLTPEEKAYVQSLVEQKEKAAGVADTKPKEEKKPEDKGATTPAQENKPADDKAKPKEPPSTEKKG